MTTRPPTRSAGTRSLMTVKEVRAELCDEDGRPLAESTWQDWRAKGTAPRCIQLPNRQLRIRRRDFDDWLTARESTGVAA